MTSFTDDLRQFLENLDDSGEFSDADHPFPRWTSKSGKLIIQIITLARYNELSPPDDIFIKQCEAAKVNKKQIIHCWEDQWQTRHEIMMSRLESVFGKSAAIHGRSCRIDQPDNAELEVFLRENHLLGPAKGKYKLGLYHREQLVSVALFARSVPVQRNGITYQSHEMIRYCSLKNTYVQGGLSKLIKAFRRMVSPDDIYTVADRDWSEGESFQSLGFRVLGFTPPMRFWLDADLERHRTPPFPEARHVVNAGNVKLLMNLRHE